MDPVTNSTKPLGKSHLSFALRRRVVKIYSRHSDNRRFDDMATSKWRLACLDAMTIVHAPVPLFEISDVYGYQSSRQTLLKTIDICIMK